MLGLVFRIFDPESDIGELVMSPTLALQLLSFRVSESMGNHDSKIVDAASVD
jgi:hypothetical protein